MAAANRLKLRLARKPIAESVHIYIRHNFVSSLSCPVHKSNFHNAPTSISDRLESAYLSDDLIRIFFFGVCEKEEIKLYLWFSHVQDCEPYYMYYRDDIDLSAFTHYGALERAHVPHPHAHTRGDTIHRIRIATDQTL